MRCEVLFSILIQFVHIVFSFRDYPANYTTQLIASRPEYDKNCNCTVYEKSFKNVLSRKRRGFVFYKGTVVVVTNVAAKRVLSPYPAGLIQSNEIDMFWDVPVAVDGWRKPWDDFIDRMRAEKKKDEQATVEDEKLKNVGVVNVSAIPSEEYYKMPYARPTWSQFPLTIPSSRKNVWNQNRRNFQGGRRKPYYRGSSRRYYPNSQRRNYVQSSSQNRNYKSPYQSYQRSSTNSDRSYRLSSQRVVNSDKTPSWHHHREYRERRDLYEKLDEFGRSLGMKLRKCMLRAVCEMKEQMLPEGESFINDVARILFTVPTDHDNTEDEFTQMALEENVDCARRFMLSCPHSPMQYFFTNFRPTAPHPTRQLTTKEIMDSIVYA